jgi:tripartite-type tricarboxylate transporter receptor subunit TctC
LLCRFPNILAVPVSSPLTSVRSFIDYARANPGKLTYSSPGIGTTPHLSGELFKRMAPDRAGTADHCRVRGSGL